MKNEILQEQFENLSTSHRRFCISVPINVFNLLLSIPLRTPKIPCLFDLPRQTFFFFIIDNLAEVSRKSHDSEERVKQITIFSGYLPARS